MNIIQIILLFNFIVTALSVCNINSNCSLRFVGIKMIILNKINNNYPKIVDSIKKQYKKCYEKSIGIISNIIIEYDKISDDDKKVLDLMISSVL
jgi:hypothetical protein